MWIVILIALTIITVVLVLNNRKQSDNTLPVTFNISNTLIKGTNMSVTLSEVQLVDGQVTPQNRLGKPAKVEAGSVSYASSDEAIATVVEDATDETKFQIIAHSPGVSQVDISADADLGEGVVTITGFVAVEVLPENASGFGVTLGEPQDQA